jgi:predicted acyl esterase
MLWNDWRILVKFNVTLLLEMAFGRQHIWQIFLDACHIVGNLNTYKYLPLVHFNPTSGKCNQVQSNNQCSVWEKVMLSRLGWKTQPSDPSAVTSEPEKEYFSRIHRSWKEYGTFPPVSAGKLFMLWPKIILRIRSTNSTSLCFKLA